MIILIKDNNENLKVHENNKIQHLNYEIQNHCQRMSLNNLIQRFKNFH